jgi:hypothetical protein
MGTVNCASTGYHFSVNVRPARIPIRINAVEAGELCACAAVLHAQWRREKKLSRTRFFSCLAAHFPHNNSTIAMRIVDGAVPKPLD